VLLGEPEKYLSSLRVFRKLFKVRVSVQKLALVSKNWCHSFGEHQLLVCFSKVLNVVQVHVSLHTFDPICILCECILRSGKVDTSLGFGLHVLRGDEGNSIGEKREGKDFGHPFSPSK